MSAPLAIRHSTTLSLSAMCKGVCPSYTMRNELIMLNIVLAITLNKGHFDHYKIMYFVSIIERLSSCPQFNYWDIHYREVYCTVSGRYTCAYTDRYFKRPDPTSRKLIRLGHYQPNFYQIPSKRRTNK